MRALLNAHCHTHQTTIFAIYIYRHSAFIDGIRRIKYYRNAQQTTISNAKHNKFAYVKPRSKKQKKNAEKKDRIINNNKQHNSAQTQFNEIE